MADLFVVLPPATELNAVIFGKNSNRPASEIQDVILLPSKDHSAGEKVKCTYIEVDQVSHTHSVVLSKPSWMWGAEMGANEKGVAIGNAPVWTKLNGPKDLEPKLLGTDIVRLALERSSSAKEAVSVITSLLQSPGQGGPCTDEPGKEGWSFHNSFLVADCREAWVLESAGHVWAAEKVTSGMRNMSNELSIRSKIDLMSPDLQDEAKKLGYNKSPLDFKSAFCAQVQPQQETSSVRTSFRFRRGKEMMEKKSTVQKKLSYKSIFTILRDEDGGICMMDGGFITAGSQVSVLLPPEVKAPDVHWFTGTPNPATSIYKPFFFGPGAEIGDLTLSRSAEAGKEVSEMGHTLFRSHKQLCQMMDSHESKAYEILSHLKELEKKCSEDVDEILNNYSEESFPKLKSIFKHMATMEINFYV